MISHLVSASSLLTNESATSPFTAGCQVFRKWMMGALSDWVVLAASQPVSLPNRMLSSFLYSCSSG